MDFLPKAIVTPLDLDSPSAIRSETRHRPGPMEPGQLSKMMLAPAPTQLENEGDKK